MVTTPSTNPLLSLPPEMQSEIFHYLVPQDLEKLRSTCRQLRDTLTWKKIEQLSINQLSQYTKKQCVWCDKAIVLIQTSYKPPEGYTNYKILRLVVDLASSPSYVTFTLILKELDCEKLLENHPSSPCVCEVD